MDIVNGPLLGSPNRTEHTQFENRYKEIHAISGKAINTPTLPINMPRNAGVKLLRFLEPGG
jgi:hypothetical protein